MSNTHDNGGPAFPRTGNCSLDQSTEFDSTSQDGMSLRDYFAAKAMQALIEKNGACHPRDAYEMADAMLAARAKQADPVRDAAPELLEALELALSHMSAPECAIWREVQGRMRSAIAKATGQEGGAA